MSPLPFAALLLLAGPPAETADVPAVWYLGTLSVAGTELRLLIELPPDGRREGDFPHGALLSPDQSPDPIPLTASAATAEILSFAVESLGLSFEGTVDPEDPGSYAGTFRQGPLPLELTMRRVSAAAADAVRRPPRPQTPTAPFPYRTEEVRFDGAAGGVALAGTLTLPDPAAHGPGPYAAAVLISGSGPQDRDETLFGHKPFAVLADALTRSGVAVLRYDDRGVGGSAGDHAAATTEDFTADARGAVRFLAAHDAVDAARVGAIGHSEGGLIAPALAAEHPDEIAFVVLLAGPAVGGEDVLIDQAAAVIRAAGGDAAAVAANRSVQDALFAAAAEADPAAASAAAVAAAVTDLPGDDRDAARAALEAQARAVDSPWMRTFLGSDPVPHLEALRCPALALFGGKDLQVTAAANLPPMTAALADHPAATVTVFPNLNHLFQPATTGLPAEYAAIETTFDPRALATITEWVNRVTAPAGNAAE